MAGGLGKAFRKGFGGRRKRWKAGWIDDITRPGARGAAQIDALVFDHGLLRIGWTNRHRVADGVWRSNQPGPSRIRRLANEGFRTIVNLRGESDWGSYLLEREACAAAGLTLVDFRLRSCRIPLPGQITMLAGLLAEAEKPLLMHCKSGADRAGFAAAIYLLARKRGGSSRCDICTSRTGRRRCSARSSTPTPRPRRPDPSAFSTGCATSMIRRRWRSGSEPPRRPVS
jgi:protein tyrosine phosphatase (PTP) superfamily phosphohydrolase (DUF442 family)